MMGWEWKLRLNENKVIWWTGWPVYHLLADKEVPGRTQCGIVRVDGTPFPLCDLEEAKKGSARKCYRCFPLSKRYLYFGRCGQCGRFVPYTDHVVSTPYGSYGDYEPPDEEYVCLSCWDKMEPKWKKLTYNVSWVKPRVIRDGVREEGEGVPE